MWASAATFRYLARDNFSLNFYAFWVPLGEEDAIPCAQEVSAKILHKRPLGVKQPVRPRAKKNSDKYKRNAHFCGITRDYFMRAGTM